MTPDAGSFTSKVSDFSLRGLEGLGEEYSPPPLGNFTPDGSWKQSYAMFVLVPKGALKVGEFSLERKVKGSADFMLGIAMRSRGNSGFSLFQRAEIQCNLDALATPVSWLFDTKLAREANDPPYMQSGYRRSASVRNSVMMVGDRLRNTSIVLDGAYSNEWSLLEAVQRLPGEKTQNMHYTLIDEFDTPQPAHTLAFRDKVNVRLKDSPSLLTGFCDLGTAVVPTTYWVDENHRLIFVCSGLTVYALNMTNGHPGQCPDRFSSSGSEGVQQPGKEVW